MVSQLEGRNTLVGLRPSVDFDFEERRRLGTSLFQETTDTSFARIVEDLCLLCTRQEQSCSDRVSPTQTLSSEQPALEAPISTQVPTVEASVFARDPKAVNSDKASFSDNEQPHARFTLLEDIIVESSELPITSTLRKQRSRRRTCLFYDGNRKDGRSRTFARPSTLRQYNKNIYFQYQVGCFICPVPGC